MRKVFAIKSIVVLLMLGLIGVSGVSGQSSGLTVEITIDRTQDLLVIYIPTNQALSLEGFSIAYEVDGVPQEAITLDQFEPFRPAEKVQGPVCLVFRTTQTQSPNSPLCANLTSAQVRTYTSLASGVWWYNRAQFTQRQLIISAEGAEVSRCDPEEIPCTFLFPFVSPVEETPPTAVPLPDNCQVDASTNLIASGDADADGLSDFEEGCIYRTDPAVANLDSDDDGLIDDVEMVLSQSNSAWANPSRPNDDQDGDQLFDAIERELRTVTNDADSDDDLISDFLEVFWLGTDPLVAERDDNQNGFPDVLERFLPPGWNPVTPCRVQVGLLIVAINVIDREEDNDPQEFVPGDEPEMTYQLGFLNQPPNNNLLRTWEGEQIMTGDVISQFTQIEPQVTTCGDDAFVVITLVESDAPFGGSENLGSRTLPVPLIFGRIPMAFQFRQPREEVFTGNSADGFYDYRVSYQLEAQITP